MTELALHIRKLSETVHLNAVGDHLLNYYGKGLIEPTDLSHTERIYVGDEFCPIRLPQPKFLRHCCQFAQENNMGLTLLIPVLTDTWLDRCGKLFEILTLGFPEAEVVVNDLGTLLFLKEEYPSLRLSMGRLFNKGFKDPRLSLQGLTLTQEKKALLSESTFDNPEFQTLLDRFDLSRVERDLMPYSQYLAENGGGHETSYYFPFGYITTGRVCWTATFMENSARDYRPRSQCSQPCKDLRFQLKSDSQSLALFQSGNTVFYLYPDHLMSALLNKAAQDDCRLIYQGACL